MAPENLGITKDEVHAETRLQTYCSVTRHVTHVGEVANEYKIFIAKFETKRQI
jgi:hypothetical protein